MRQELAYLTKPRVINNSLAKCNVLNDYLLITEVSEDGGEKMMTMHTVLDQPRSEKKLVYKFYAVLYNLLANSILPSQADACPALLDSQGPL